MSNLGNVHIFTERVCVDCGRLITVDEYNRGALHTCDSCRSKSVLADLTQNSGRPLCVVCNVTPVPETGCVCPDCTKDVHEELTAMRSVRPESHLCPHLK